MIPHRSRALRQLLLVGLVASLLVPSSAHAGHETSHVSISGVAQAEGDEGTTIFSFQVEVDPPSDVLDEDITVRYGTVDGTAVGSSECGSGDGDYESDDGEVTIDHLQLPPYTETIPVTVCGDSVLEHHETFEVHLLEVTDGNAEIVDGEATGTIWNDDPPELTISDGSGVESETIVFFLRLSHQTVNEVEVHVETRDDTTTAGEDYEPIDETVAIAPHATERTISVETIQDGEVEGDETFLMELSEPSSATIGDPVGEGLITDDDAFTVDAGPEKSGESAAQVSFTGEATGGTPSYTFTWDFGDGTAEQTGTTVRHRFVETGTFNVTLTVEDSTGATATDATAATITDSGKVDRSFGTNREGTAIDVSSDHWNQADTVLLATGYAHADALAAGPLAKELAAPLLLTNPNGLPDEVKRELARLGAQKVIILGGAHAVPQEQADELARDYEVQRIAGVNRFGTAADIAMQVGATPASEVTVSLGDHAEENRDDWPDALSAGSFASLSNPLPSLLTHSQFVPDETLDALDQLDTERIFLLGGSVAISEAVELQLEGEGYTVQRVFGADRYGTSVAAGEIVMDRYPAGQRHPVFATGQKFPDGLTGGALAGEVVGPVVLVPTDTLDDAPVVREFLRDHADPFDVGTIVGGEAVVSQTVQTQARSDIDTS